MPMRSSLLCLIGTVCCASGSPLLLTPLIEAGELARARASSAVEIESEALGYSGLITVPVPSSTNANNIFFWYQPCTNGCNPSTAETVVWLQGGPGAPGTHGAMGEIGNWYIDPVTHRMKTRCYSWCATRNCVFVDQPIQTGFSFQTNASGHAALPADVIYTASSSDAMQQVLQVLLQLRILFPATKPAPLVIAGESYGGIYCANLGMVISRHNAANPVDQVNLAAILVGDPAMNPVYQWPQHATALFGMGLIMSDERDDLAKVFDTAVQHAHAGNCTAAFSYWDSVWNDAGGGGAPGRFFELTGSSFPESALLDRPPSEWTPYKAWLNSKTVMKALHVDGIPRSSGQEGVVTLPSERCTHSGLVYSTMVNSGDFCSNSSELYASLFLEGQIDLLVFSSTVDALLGPPTTDAGVAAVLDHAASLSPVGDSLRAQYRKAPKSIWRVDSADDNVAGFAKCAHHGSTNKRFCFAVVKNAGHEMPSYQPRVALDMYERFVAGRSFNSSGNAQSSLPSCAQCSGVQPFAGPSPPTLAKCSQDTP